MGPIKKGDRSLLIRALDLTPPPPSLANLEIRFKKHI